MSNTPSPALSTPASAPFAFAEKILDWLDSVPYWVLALPLRAAAATVFWRSGLGKLANWETTLYLFADEYKLPLIPPELAARAATAIELTLPVLLVVGLATRASSAVLLGMTAVIQLFVYPMSWPTHIQWAAVLLVILFRGPGAVSLDYFVRLKFMPRNSIWNSQA